MKAMMKDAVILFLITLVSGLMLGFVYDLTKEPIAAQNVAKKNAAYQTVFPDAADFEIISEKPELAPAEVSSFVQANGFDADIDEIASAKDASGQDIGYVITVTDHEGYGGDITFAMGIKNDGILNGVSILSIAETAGLGMRADEVLVPQMPGKDLTKEVTFTKSGNASGNEVDAISGATITTTAFVNGINAGRCVLNDLLLSGKGVGSNE
ncbi:MAG: RnfABCDGE type electron transport complex subunit G [Lachnospiraceae bacterium]|nr:RnfABCDGE type electron transport complex subunit G [Lachnospiraceae bacterium]